MELRGRTPSGVLVPPIDVRLTGRGGGMSRDDAPCTSVLLAGRYEVTDAREEGREASASRGLRFGSGPKDRRDTPDVDSRGTWLLFEEVLDEKLFVLPVPPMLDLPAVGVASSVPATDDAALPTVRFLDRIVTVEGTGTPAVRGDARGGVVTGAGSLERTDCTRASSRCICAVSERMCDNEVELGIL